MIIGSCACGKVAYEADQLDGPVVHCHCDTCRKVHASAFSSTARVRRDHYRWLQGHALIRNFESSRGKRRHFCRSCGTHLIAEWSLLDFVILRMGAVDTDPKSLPSMHIWYARSPAWLRYGEELPHYSQGPKSSLMTPLRVESGPDNNG